MIIISSRYRSVRPLCVWPRVTSPVSARGPGGRTPTCAASVAWSTTRAALQGISPIWRRPRRSRGRLVTTLKATVTCFTSVVRYFALSFFYETYESIIICIIYHIKKSLENVYWKIPSVSFQFVIRLYELYYDYELELINITWLHVKDYSTVWISNEGLLTFFDIML